MSREGLAALLDRVDGGIAAAIGDMDGLLIEGFSKRRLDLEAAVAEHAALLRQTQAAYAKSLGSPRLEEFIAIGQGVVGYARLGPENLFLLLLLTPSGNLGQARLQTGRFLQKR
ncbi:MAG: hypothetical protein ACUVUP_05820 [Thermaceae bacterium]